jgi:hypothetical protein
MLRMLSFEDRMNVYIETGVPLRLFPQAALCWAGVLTYQQTANTLWFPVFHMTLFLYMSNNITMFYGRKHISWHRKNVKGSEGNVQKWQD